MCVSCLYFELVARGFGTPYEHNRCEGHSFELDDEFVTGLELCGWFVWGLGCDGADEALCPLWYAWEVEELSSSGR